MSGLPVGPIWTPRMCTNSGDDRCLTVKPHLLRSEVTIVIRAHSGSNHIPHRAPTQLTQPTEHA